MHEMPHQRKRHVVHAFTKLKAHAPIIGVFGHRQVGKSTFLEAQSSEYTSLDDPDTLELATQSPKEFIQSLRGEGTAIDECQLAPPLFPLLKLRVQKNKRPGQFFLSGSVRFTSRKAIRESLTGRIATVEVFPMVISELRNEPLPDFLPRALEAQDFTSFASQAGISGGDHKAKTTAIHKYLEHGGLPGICFIREEKTRTRLLQDILNTILDRDLRLVYSTPLPISDIFGLCQEVAANPLLPPNITTLSRKLRLAPRTLKSLLNALESVFMLRRIPIEGGGRKGPLYWFEDQLEQNFLARNSLTAEAQRIGFIYRNARAQFEYRLGATPTYFHFRTRAGASVPLAIRTQEGVLGLFLLKDTSELTRSESASIDSFLKANNRSKVLVLTEESPEIRAISDRVMIAPMSLVF